MLRVNKDREDMERDIVMFEVVIRPLYYVTTQPWKYLKDISFREVDHLPVDRKRGKGIYPNVIG